MAEKNLIEANESAAYGRRFATSKQALLILFDGSGVTVERQLA